MNFLIIFGSQTNSLELYTKSEREGTQQQKQQQQQQKQQQQKTIITTFEE